MGRNSLFPKCFLKSAKSHRSWEQRGNNEEFSRQELKKIINFFTKWLSLKTGGRNRGLNFSKNVFLFHPTKHSYCLFIRL